MTHETSVSGLPAVAFSIAGPDGANSIGNAWFSIDRLDSFREFVAVREGHSFVYAYLAPKSNAALVDGTMAAILAEVEKATRKFPTWPTDPLHAAGVLNEEVGELNKALLQAVYEPHKSTVADVRMEAIQAAAMAYRFIASLDRYQYTKGEQHEQAALATHDAEKGGA